MRAFLDVETTGFQPGQIAQLAYIITDEDFNVQLAKNFYFNVDKMPKGASDVHGLTKAKLKKLSGGKIFADHVDEIYNDLFGANVICHNTEYDMDFLRAEFRRLSRDLPCKPGACTMHHYTDLCALPGGPRGKYKWPKLHEAMAYVNVSPQQARDIAQELFAAEDVSFHDSRMDTASVFAMCRRMSKDDMDAMIHTYQTKPARTARKEVAAATAPVQKKRFSPVVLWIIASLLMLAGGDSLAMAGTISLIASVVVFVRQRRVAKKEKAER